MQGLDSLAVRLASYREAGCVFAKWPPPLEPEPYPPLPNPNPNPNPKSASS